MKFCWTTLMVKDLEESLKFYIEVVGLKIDHRFSPVPGREIAFLGDGETKLELVWNKDVKEASFGQSISLGFEVNSLDEKINLVKEKGIAIHSGPFQPIPSTKFFYVLDPDGLKIQFVENM